ncbi:MAG: M56 family metallopeptidase [Bacteroidales bacterium]|nr:M56 family metallopeptidase [Bacteroidales bacterium]
MNSFLIYLFQSSVALSILYICYWMLMRKETWFGFNRMYLLTAPIIALLIPVIDLQPFVGSEINTYTLWLSGILISGDGAEKAASSEVGIWNILFWIYIAGAGLAVVRLLVSLWKMVVLMIEANSSKTDGFRIFRTESDNSPFSFFRFIFYGKNIPTGPELQKILAHEKVHIQQGHTYDIMLMELFCIFQWFNPFAWLSKKSIKIQHEYLADRAVIHGGIHRSDYMNLLLSQQFGPAFIPIVHQFNQSQIKNRFIMITKQRTPKIAMLKPVIIIPVLAGLLYLFSLSTDAIVPDDDLIAKADLPENNVMPPQEEDKVYTMVEEMPEYPGGDEARIKYFQENITYPEAAKKNGIEGRVFVSFIVEKDGSITHVEVLRGIGGGCDEEAVRVISAMPNWKPGKQKGKPVRVQFNMPIEFKLSKRSKEEGKLEKKSPSGNQPPMPYENIRKAGTEKSEPDKSDKK